jgi:hypothetical protein
MRGHRELHCPNNCAEGRFEALNAPMIVDSAGRYLGHDASHATYVCALCRSVAVDLAAAAREMARDSTATPVTLTCPGCGTEMLPPEDEPLAERLECPICALRFDLEEGMPQLHGGGSSNGEFD